MTDLQLRLMWVVRDHGIEGKAQPGRVVGIYKSEAAARSVDNYGYSHNIEQVLYDRGTVTARFVSKPHPVSKQGPHD